MTCFNSQPPGEDWEPRASPVFTTFLSLSVEDASGKLAPPVSREPWEDAILTIFG